MSDGNGEANGGCHGCEAGELVNELHIRHMNLDRDNGVILAELRALKEHVNTQLGAMSREIARLVTAVHEFSETLRSER